MPGASPPSDAARAGEPLVFRTPAGMRYFSLFATLVIGAMSAFMIGAAAVLFFQADWGVGAVLAALGIFMAGLCGYVLRDLRGRWGLRAALFDDHMVLDLPADRSLIHRPSAQHLTIPYSDVAAVETRLEAYPSLGMASMQRAYVLSLKQGHRIFLFEDRAIGTPMEWNMYSAIADAIVERSGVPLRELGMVQGGGGFLAVWGTSTPDWAAPSLPLAQQIRIWRHVALTGSLATSTVIIALLIGGLFQ